MKFSNKIIVAVSLMSFFSCAQSGEGVSVDDVATTAVELQVICPNSDIPFKWGSDAALSVSGLSSGVVSNTKKISVDPSTISEDGLKATFAGKVAQAENYRITFPSTYTAESGFSMEGQTQKGDNSTAHLDDYIVMSAPFKYGATSVSLAMNTCYLAVNINEWPNEDVGTPRSLVISGYGDKTSIFKSNVSGALSSSVELDLEGFSGDENSLKLHVALLSIAIPKEVDLSFELIGDKGSAIAYYDVDDDSNIFEEAKQYHVDISLNNALEVPSEGFDVYDDKVDLIKHVRNYEYYVSTSISKYDGDEPAAKGLHFDSKSRNLTSEELAAFKKYLLSYQLPKHNYLNYYFRKRMNSYMMEWVYKKDGDIALVNRAIDIARQAIKYRNDNIGKQDDMFDSYVMDYSHTVAPLWPNYKRAYKYSDGTVGLEPGASLFAGLNTITVPIRMIVEDGSLGSKKYNGKTYNDIVEELTTEALKVVDYSYDTFVGEDNTPRYPEVTGYDPAYRGEVFIFNRVLPLISGVVPLIEAFEIEGKNSDRVAKMDAVNNAMIDAILGRFEEHTVGGVRCAYYPYSVMKDYGIGEDFTHGSFDARDFQLLHLSGRYSQLSDEKLTLVANSIVEVVATDELGVYNERMNGGGSLVKPSTPINYDGYIWYTNFNSGVSDVIVKHLVKNNKVKYGGNYDIFLLYELFKLKEKGLFEIY